jgi:hypothetical protein
LYATGINTGISIKTDVGNIIININNGTRLGLSNGDSVMFTALTSPTGFAINTTYYVVNATSTSIQIATTPGGSALTISAAAGTMSIGGTTIANKVVTVNANANVVINGYAQLTNASASVTARNLNQNYATTKNWTVTG